MKKAVLYIHGKSGSAEESKHYESLFENFDVIGMDYHSKTVWEAKSEFPVLFDSLCGKYDSISVIANSIGAYFAMSCLNEKKIDKAFFISPVVDMQKLIEDMMRWANVSQSELFEKKTIKTEFGEDLSWEYYQYAKSNKIRWNVPTHILYGSADNLTAINTVSDFKDSIGATLTVMNGGEHWFHTELQMQFLDNWLKTYIKD